MKSTANGEKIIDYGLLDEGHSGNTNFDIYVFIIYIKQGCA